MEALTGKVEQQAAELEKLHSRLQRLETPLIIRVIKGIWRLLFGCGGGRRNAVAAGSSAGNDTKSRCIWLFPRKVYLSHMSTRASYLSLMP